MLFSIGNSFETLLLDEVVSQHLVGIQQLKCYTMKTVLQLQDKNVFLNIVWLFQNFFYLKQTFTAVFLFGSR